MAGLICVGIRKFEIGGQRKRISSNAAILNLESRPSRVTDKFFWGANI